MLAPPEDAIPISEIHSPADELFCTRNPFSGTMPPNSICGAPPVATVPLPSLAAAAAVLTTGSGFCGPTGVATPCALLAAGTCTGTRLPFPSSAVASACTAVLASFTRSVMEPCPPSRRAAIGFENAVPGARLDQQLGHCPNQRIDPVGRASCRAAIEAASETTPGARHERAHLVFESRERADVAHPPLLV